MTRPRSLTPYIALALAALMTLAVAALIHWAPDQSIYISQ
jgi:hypothetical protein